METFAIIFVTSLLPSLFDMGSDALSVQNFLHGSSFPKYVNSSQCTHVGSYLRINCNVSEVDYMEVKYFELPNLILVVLQYFHMID